MGAYIAKRLLLMIPTLVGVMLMTFAIIQFVPGGPVEELISKVRAVGSARGAKVATISAAEVANIKSYFGFDRPAHERYLKWLGDLLRGDFGKSYVYHAPVLEVILSKMPVSLFFGLTSGEFGLELRGARREVLRERGGRAE